MEIGNLGTVTKDQKLNWYYSAPTRVPVMGGTLSRIIVEGYDEDSNKEDFHAAIANFLAIDRSVLTDVEQHVFQYYKDVNEGCWEPDDDEYIAIEWPSEVWNHVQLGEPVVTRRHYGDKGVYVSLECSCDWEEEHGLQIVFKDGLKVNKIGPYDGHLTNSDAYADDSLEDVVYRNL